MKTHFLGQDELPCPEKNNDSTEFESNLLFLLSCPPPEEEIKERKPKTFNRFSSTSSPIYPAPARLAPHQHIPLLHNAGSHRRRCLLARRPTSLCAIVAKKLLLPAGARSVGANTISLLVPRFSSSWRRSVLSVWRQNLTLSGAQRPRAKAPPISAPLISPVSYFSRCCLLLRE